MGGFKISLLVPFRSNPEDPGYAERIRNYEWIKAFWEEQLPLAEFILGHDESVPFSKTRAVNDAATRATGDIFVILDADAYLQAEVIETAAREIRLAQSRGQRLWFVPYRRFYRLNDQISDVITQSDPGNPLVLPDPPARCYAEDIGTYSWGDSTRRAHWFGALIQILPREAFELVGGMDARFQGWGAEDVAFMKAVDTLYSPHKTLNRSVCHLYHPRIGKFADTRKWAGQASANVNWVLSDRYSRAKGDPVRMRELVEENKYEPGRAQREPNPGDGENRPKADSPETFSGAVDPPGFPGELHGGSDGLHGEPSSSPFSQYPAFFSYLSPESAGSSFPFSVVPGGEAVPDSKRAGSPGRKRFLGRLKTAVRAGKSFCVFWWSLYIRLASRYLVHRAP